MMHIFSASPRSSAEISGDGARERERERERESASPRIIAGIDTAAPAPIHFEGSAPNATRTPPHPRRGASQTSFAFGAHCSRAAHNVALVMLREVRAYAQPSARGMEAAGVYLQSAHVRRRRRPGRPRREHDRRRVRGDSAVVLGLPVEYALSTVHNVGVPRQPPLEFILEAHPRAREGLQRRDGSSAGDLAAGGPVEREDAPRG